LVDAEDGEEAISLLLNEPFDILICDKNLPGITGLDVIRQAKAVDVNMGTLLITAFASQESAEEALVIGVDDYVVKPFDLTDLENKVFEAIERRVERLAQKRQGAIPTRQIVRRVLVCEPPGESRTMLIEGIELLGHKTSLVSSISQILEALRNQEANALICDLDILIQNNASTCFLRSALMVTDKLPFIVLASDPGLRSTVEAINRGAQKVICRPIKDSVNIAEVLEPLLGKATRR
jgi:DNA-binding NtrC family response regulator